MRRAAETRARDMPARDPLFAPWARATIGEPVLVRTTAGRPSYWVVPVELSDRAIGFVRVGMDAKAVAAGVLYRDPSTLRGAPDVVTGIGSEAAVAQAREVTGDGSVEDEPMYVHDGPPGREAWMVPVRDGSGARRAIFVTAGGWYERSDADPADRQDLE